MECLSDRMKNQKTLTPFNLHITYCWVFPYVNCIFPSPVQVGSSAGNDLPLLYLLLLLRVPFNGSTLVSIVLLGSRLVLLVSNSDSLWSSRRADTAAVCYGPTESTTRVNSVLNPLKVEAALPLITVPLTLGTASWESCLDFVSPHGSPL
ncbi:hypothetical protein B0H19DRAFT_284579 [Mycena capillaripes]|nr:hypothetical protein B0H19DRAFT_284579 [Mycena capillaripes]